MSATTIQDVLIPMATLLNFTSNDATRPELCEPWTLTSKGKDYAVASDGLIAVLCPVAELEGQRCPVRGTNKPAPTTASVLAYFPKATVKVDSASYLVAKEQTVRTGYDREMGVRTCWLADRKFQTALIEKIQTLPNVTFHRPANEEPRSDRFFSPLVFHFGKGGRGCVYPLRDAAELPDSGKEAA